MFRSMRFSTHSARTDLPSDLVAELIDQMFRSMAWTILGGVCGVGLGIGVSWQTGSRWPIGCTMAIALVTIGRVLLTRAYRRQNRLAQIVDADFRRWELKYAVSGWLFSALVGALNFIETTVNNDTTSYLLFQVLSIGITSGFVLRHAGRPRVALGLVSCSTIPLIAAWILRGDPTAYALAAANAFYLLATAGVIHKLFEDRAQLLLARREQERLSASLAAQNLRLDAAISNMPHGLSMFDADHRLVVHNQRFCELFDIGPQAIQPGMTITEIISNNQKQGHTAGKQFAGWLSRDRFPRQSKVEMRDGRIIAYSQRPMSDGGAVVLFEDVTERERAEARARFLATHDELTGLPNRWQFNQSLSDAVRAGQQFAVMFIDLDRFKIINDTLGHEAGDMLLKEVATRLTGCVRKSDIVARLAGDEFVVIVRDNADAAIIEALAQDILSSILRPIRIFDQECDVSASIGVSRFPIDALDEQSLKRNADSAMYAAKESGRSAFRFYSEAANAQSRNRLTLEADLRRALGRNEFVLYYRPRKQLMSGGISGFEALLRWRHPELGLLSPDRFVSLAEDTGLILPIGKWALRTACTEFMGWQNSGSAPARLAVALTPRQIADENLIGDVRDALQSANMSPALLELKIAGSALTRNIERSSHLLRPLHEMGVGVTIDDFGIGYSAMPLVVNNLPIGALAIDRCFVRDVAANANTRIVVEAMIALGKALNLTVIAEGVESPEEEAFFRDHACDEIQGDMFAEPLPGERVISFFAEHERSRMRSLGGSSSERKVRPAAV